METNSAHNLASIDLWVNGAQAHLLRLDAMEAVGELFRFQVDVVFKTPNQSLLVGDCLGTSTTVTITQRDEATRYFNGVIMATEFLDQYYGQDRDWHHHVRLYMAPQLFVYSHNQDYRLFEEKSAPDIIATVLAESGCNLVKNLKRGYEIRGYTTQFGESNFAFISRLMEEEGIYYYFQHEDGKHSIVLCDAPSSHSDGQPAKLEYNPTARNLNIGESVEGDNQVHTWVQKQTAHAQKEFTLWDNLFTVPGNTFEAKSTAIDSDADPTKFFRKVETYDFQETYELHQPASGAEDPGIANKHITAAKTRAQTRREILEARRKTYLGIALSPVLACGHKFTLDKPPHFGSNAEFMLVRVHTVTYGAAFGSVNPDSGWPDDAATKIEAIPAYYVWRSQPTTPKPVVHGPQTAIVVGPKDEEIFTDKYGRVKVQFYWDRYGKKDPHSSAWLRVSQTGGLGNINMPRVGHEVLVGFLDGNPDRPIVIGRLFNGDNMPIYTLPDHKTRTVWRSKTYGVPTGKNAKEELGKESKPLEDVKDTDGNELRFEDKYGEEEVFFLAHRNMNTRIRFDETHHVGRNQETKIWFDAVRDVERDQSLSIGRDSEVTIGQHSTIETKGNEKRTVTGTSDVTITGNHTVKMEAEASYTTNGKNTVKVDGDDKQTYGGKSDVKVSGALTIESGEKILLKVGGNSIEISQTGIKINGMMVKIEGTTMAEVSSAMTTVKASGILTAQGSLVKIN